ncbi:MAG: sulfite exporter TauE/SafE family protein [Rhodoferax sp.]
MMSPTALDAHALALLGVSAWGAGVLNAIAGGGSFLTLPALLAVGVPPIPANATSALAVSPGYLGSVWGFRRELAALPRTTLGRETLVAAAGGVAGAVLLLLTPAALFARLVPWLLLLATLLFALGPRWMRSHAPRATAPAADPGPASEARPAGAAASAAPHMSATAAPGAPSVPGAPRPRWHLAALALVCVYGGYFNGGLGILLMALYTVGGEARLNTVNALKNLHSLVLSLLSVAAFVLAGVIEWRAGVLMMAAATLGGAMGAHWARLLPAAVVRTAVVLIGLGMSAVFFGRSGA